MLLGLVEQYARKGCAGQIHAKDKKGMERCFGGLNLVTGGDWMQLPAVLQKSIFRNPFLQDYESPEERIKNMFWQIDEETIPSSPADLFELQEQVRCEDEWLMAVLDANRQGAETWEMYCFTHGLPTLHVGSWFPAEKTPRCGQSICEGLQSTHWPEMFRRKATWEQRSSLECNTCQQERRRRCRVLTSKTLDQGTTLTDTGLSLIHI